MLHILLYGMFDVLHVLIEELSDFCGFTVNFTYCFLILLKGVGFESVKLHLEFFPVILDIMKKSEVVD